MKAVFSIFPKFYKHLNPQELAALVNDVGLDTTHVVVRNGYWVTPDGLADEMPGFVKALRSEGLDIKYVTSDFLSDELIDDPTPLSVMADCGLSHFRLSHFRSKDPNVHNALAEARSQLERLLPLCEKHNLKCMYQVHHGTLVPSASAAFHLVHDLPTEWIGIELDPGNQLRDGYERWDFAAPLLGSHFAALGVKDVSLIQGRNTEGPDKGWKHEWATLYEGINDWHACLRALAGIRFDGYFEFMPFYDTDRPGVMTRKLQKEVSWLRSIYDDVK